MRIKYGIIMTYFDDTYSKDHVSDMMERAVYIKNNILDGEYKDWYSNGDIYLYSYFKNGEKIKVIIW